MGKFVYYGVQVRWRDGRKEMFRYETEQQARDAEHFQFVDNWEETKYAIYVGRRIDWVGIWRSIFG